MIIEDEQINQIIQNIYYKIDSKLITKVESHFEFLKKLKQTRLNSIQVLYLRTKKKSLKSLWDQNLSKKFK